METKETIGNRNNKFCFQFKALYLLGYKAVGNNGYRIYIKEIKVLIRHIRIYIYMPNTRIYTM